VIASERRQGENHAPDRNRAAFLPPLSGRREVGRRKSRVSIDDPNTWLAAVTALKNAFDAIRSAISGLEKFGRLAAEASVKRKSSTKHLTSLSDQQPSPKPR
jgi:hypothetical protein